MIIDNDVLLSLGVKTLRPAQQKVIEALITGRNILAIMPTGSGKTLCFQYAAAVSASITIIIYPLVSLMNDQEKRFRNAGFSVSVLKGGQTKGQREAAFSALESGEVKVLITNVEMLIQKNIADRLKKMKISLLVADEAHTLVQWKSFRSAFNEITKIVSALRPEKIAAFTATADEETIKGLEASVFSNRTFCRIRFSSDRENIIYKSVLTLSKSFALLNILENSARPAVIFANNRIVTEVLADFLKKRFSNTDVYFYHAGLSKTERRKTENAFYKSHNGILVSTCAFGMGVDKSDIRTVIHYIVSDSVSSFLQESGRAGRDGNEAVSYVLVKKSEMKLCHSEKRKKLFYIFTGSSCIRKELLTAMGEETDGLVCRGCSVCLDDKYSDVLSRTVEDFVKFTKKSYKENDAALILKGIEIPRLPYVRLLPFFGSLKYTEIRFISDAVKEAY